MKRKTIEEFCYDKMFLDDLFVKLKQCISKYEKEYLEHRFELKTEDENIKFQLPEALFPYMIGISMHGLRTLFPYGGANLSVLKKFLDQKEQVTEEITSGNLCYFDFFSKYTDICMKQFLDMPAITLDNIASVAKPDSCCYVLQLQDEEAEARLFLMVEDKLETCYVARTLLSDAQCSQYYEATKWLHPHMLIHKSHRKATYESLPIAKKKKRRRE